MQCDIHADFLQSSGMAELMLFSELVPVSI